MYWAIFGWLVYSHLYMTYCVLFTRFRHCGNLFLFCFVPYFSVMRDFVGNVNSNAIGNLVGGHGRV